MLTHRAAPSPETYPYSENLLGVEAEAVLPLKLGRQAISLADAAWQEQVAAEMPEWLREE